MKVGIVSHGKIHSESHDFRGDFAKIFFAGRCPAPRRGYRPWTPGQDSGPLTGHAPPSGLKGLCLPIDLLALADERWLRRRKSAARG